MKINTNITWVLLILLTIISAFVAKLENTYVAIIILLLAAFKFIGIAFQFMELKKAHSFWKGITVGFVLVFIVSIGLLL
ncbi:MAG: cytochrome C oxidase subunit IV family protein [Oceanihabitans sp.]